MGVLSYLVIMFYLVITKNHKSMANTT